MLIELPLQNGVANQRFSTTVNNQNLTFDIFKIKDFIFVNVYIDATMIIAGARAIHGSYINQYTTNLVGYLFFYSDDGLDPTYDRLGTISHLLYADYDALAKDYANWLILNGLS